jgi:ABC-type uncharacterized transport system YnjBCD permease subunit
LTLNAAAACPADANVATRRAMFALLDLSVVRITLTAMVALGPLTVAQYVFWSRRFGVERTTWQYQQAGPGH